VSLIGAVVSGAKPLGRKSYGSIGHLYGSRLGPGDHHIHEGQTKAMTEALPKRDWLVVQEKVDGSNVGVCKLNGEIYPLVRAGWDARTSPREQHQMFARWVERNVSRFAVVLAEGQRICGEWMAQAHGTKYALPHEPFVAFDIFDANDERLTHARFNSAVAGAFATPHVFHSAAEAFPAASLPDLQSHHGALDPMEGVVYRWERGDRVLMLAKWVRPEKKDGCYLDCEAADGPVWNWRDDSIGGAP
jgi:hypothetical protein